MSTLGIESHVPQAGLEVSFYFKLLLGVLAPHHPWPVGWSIDRTPHPNARNLSACLVLGFSKLFDQNESFELVWWTVLV